MTLTQANNYLAVHLNQVLSKEKKNVFLSPFSISVAMGMLTCGAAGKTASELRAALGHENAGIKFNEIASVFEKEMSFLTEHSDSYTLSFANSMLSQIGFHVKDEYKQIISKCFQSMTMEVDFEKDGKKVVNQINEWVNEKTNGKIPSLVKSLPPITVLVLLNAIYFKGTWVKKFNKNDTKPKKFYNNGAENKAKTVDMMYLKESFPFFEDKKYKALQLPYVGDEIAMMILLPCEKNGLDELEATLLPSFIQDVKIKLRKMKVRVFIPRFRLEYEKMLIPSFKEMGVQRIFFSDAELSNVSSEPDLKVGLIQHKAMLEVNEEGSEAAAFTGVRIVGRSAPRPVPEFMADHPFILVIYNTKNDLILFMGRVNEL